MAEIKELVKRGDWSSTYWFTVTLGRLGIAPFEERQEIRREYHQEYEGDGA